MSRDSGSKTVTTRFVWLPHGSAAGWLLLHRTVQSPTDSTDEFWRSERISPGAALSGALTDSGPEWRRMVTGVPVPFLLWPFFLAAVTDRELPAVREQIIRSLIRPIADISAEVDGTAGGVSAPRVALAADPFGPTPDDLGLGAGWDVGRLGPEGRREALLGAVQARLRHAGIREDPDASGPVWQHRFAARPVTPESTPAGLGEVLAREPVRRAIADLLAAPANSASHHPTLEGPQPHHSTRPLPTPEGPAPHQPAGPLPTHEGPAPQQTARSTPAPDGPEPPRPTGIGADAALSAVEAVLREHGWALRAEPLRWDPGAPARGFLGRLVLFCDEDSTLHRIVTTPACAEVLRRQDGLAADVARQLCPLDPTGHGSQAGNEAFRAALRRIPAEWDAALPGTAGLAPPAWDEITTVTRDDSAPGGRGVPLPRGPVEISHVELVDSNGRHSWRIDLTAPHRPRTDADH